MTTDDLVKQVLQGILMLVGEYRGSHAAPQTVLNNQ
jgi:hypothetical protein